MRPPGAMQTVAAIPTGETATPPVFPVRWPPDYRALAESLGPASALLKMGDFHPSELEPDPDALDDPVGEGDRSPVPFLLRKYPDRALVLAAARCFSYCRFCFRRGEPPESRGQPRPDDWERICAWLRSHPEVEEVILSGGDPLTLPDRRLAGIGNRLAAIPSVRRWRIHTRAPVVLPKRVTSRLVEALTAVTLPLRVVLHANHPAEVSPGLVSAIARLQEGGIQLSTQAVLLRGVNDHAATLLQLYGSLASQGVQPYYLHHPDAAQGTAGFRLDPLEGLQIYREFTAAWEAGTVGFGPPAYVRDQPDGSGKQPVRA